MQTSRLHFTHCRQDKYDMTSGVIQFPLFVLCDSRGSEVCCGSKFNLLLCVGI